MSEYLETKPTEELVEQMYSLASSLVACGRPSEDENDGSLENLRQDVMGCIVMVAKELGARFEHEQLVRIGE